MTRDEFDDHMEPFREPVWRLISFRPYTGQQLGVVRMDGNGFEHEQDGKPAGEFKLYRRGVWLYEEMMVHEDNGIILGKLTIKRTLLSDGPEVKASNFMAAGGGYTDPWPGEGF